MRSETWPIGKLKGWDKNPRKIFREDFERLKKQIQQLGSYKPLLVTEDGTVLGGNMRLKALQALGQSEVWVSVVSAPDDDTKLAYALSDNDRAGTYDEQSLAELVELSDIDPSLYKVDLGEPVTLDKIEVGMLDAFNALPDGDKPGFQQITFTLSDSQVEIVKAAIDNAKADTDKWAAENDNQNGNALTVIAEAYGG